MSENHEQLTDGFLKSEIIIHTGHPLPGLDRFGYSLYQPNLIERMRGSLTLETMVSFINDVTHQAEKNNMIHEDDILDVRLCPDDHAIWLVKFRNNESDVHRCVECTLPKPENQDHPGGDHDPPPDDQAIISVNGHLRDDIESSFDRRMIKQVAFSEPENDNLPTVTIAVGIVDRYSHEENEDEENVNHATVIADIIRQGSNVVPLSIPMVQDTHQHTVKDTDEKLELDEDPIKHQGDPTVFDLICALSRKSEIDKVQVVNISQGFRWSRPHDILYRVLKKIEKPIICSAGNGQSNNDEDPNWPANFSLYLPNVISVTSIRESGEQYGNFGDKSVTLCATGSWHQPGAEKEILGTSFSAAWVSRMYAEAFAREGRSNLNIRDVMRIVSNNYKVNDDSAIRTKENLQFYAEPAEKMVLSEEL